MRPSFRSKLVAALAVSALVLSTGVATAASATAPTAALPAPLTPPEAAEPRINGPAVFGVRLGSPVLYSIPATGERPVTFAADGLPPSLSLDPATGRISGVLREKGEFRMVLRATNKLGSAEKKFRIVAGDRIALTPPMGWSSWNCFGKQIDQEKILRTARAMVSSGLSRHGYVYVNMDDGWQGKRTGAEHALQGNEHFPDLKKLVDEIHALGLKAGIYSTPWQTSYASFPGGSADSEDGTWNKAGGKFGKVSFAKADARQWAAWGIDYLKYDWHVIDVPHVAEISEALHATGRDIILSLSNTAPRVHGTDWARLAECWRTTGDIYDVWRDGDQDWHYSVSEIGFSQEAWAPFAGPGHWNDPDMLVVGQLGWGRSIKATRLTPDQQYSHISLWALLSAPLILGCDLEKLDPFTLGLLSNDEVIGVDQDELGTQAVRVGSNGAVDFYSKPLADGSHAFGVFNRGSEPATVSLKKLKPMGVGGTVRARDLWRQKDLGVVTKDTTVTVPPCGVVLLKLSAVK